MFHSLDACVSYQKNMSIVILSGHDMYLFFNIFYYVVARDLVYPVLMGPEPFRMDEIQDKLNACKNCDTTPASLLCYAIAVSVYVQAF